MAFAIAVAFAIAIAVTLSMPFVIVLVIAGAAVIAPAVVVAIFMGSLLGFFISFLAGFHHMAEIPLALTAMMLVVVVPVAYAVMHSAGIIEAEIRIDNVETG